MSLTWIEEYNQGYKDGLEALRACCGCKGTRRVPRYAYDAASNESYEQGTRECNGSICARINEIRKRHGL